MTPRSFREVFDALEADTRADSGPAELLDILRVARDAGYESRGQEGTIEILASPLDPSPMLFNHRFDKLNQKLALELIARIRNVAAQKGLV